MRRHRILIVEDDPDLAEVILSNIEGAGYDAVLAPDGLAALETYERERPDLVTLDLRIPTMSGFRLLQLLKRSQVHPAVPVIVVTALNFEEGEEVVRYGADDYLTKPFDPAELIARIDYLLRPRAVSAPS